jgi:hypothetical protein
MSAQQSKPVEQTLTLDETNSVQILSQFVEIAQQKGAYLLSEAEALKRAMDVLLLKAEDKEVNEILAKQLLIQGVQKGQRHGSYTINDAALLNKVVQFVIESLPKESQGQPQAQPESEPQQSSPSNSDDLADLAEPIPLKPKEV